MQQPCFATLWPMTFRALPPAVRHPLCRPVAMGAALCLLWLLVCALLLAWVSGPQAGGLRPAVALLAAVSAALGLWWGWCQMGQGMLAWDGEQWWLHGAGAAQPVRLRIWADGGRWLWAQALCQGRRRQWLLLAEGLAPETWGELRRAVYFPARPSDRPQ